MRCSKARKGSLKSVLAMMKSNVCGMKKGHLKRTAETLEALRMRARLAKS
jgi:hypothetical protein